MPKITVEIEIDAPRGNLCYEIYPINKREYCEAYLVGHCRIFDGVSIEDSQKCSVCLEACEEAVCHE